MDTKKRLSEWTLEECKEYCENRRNELKGKRPCDNCDLVMVCLQGACYAWKFDALTDGEKAIMRACGAKCATKEFNGTRFVSLWKECPKPNEGYSSNNYIGAVDGGLFPSVSVGNCVELED